MRTTLRSTILALAIFLLPLVGMAGAPVDINTADAQELTTLDGIGPQKAEAIVAYRTEHGPFASPQDLLKVKGIGEKTLEANGERIIVGPSATQ
jgi:competence protein ComEA